MWYWIFKYVLIGPVLRIFGRPTIDGAHHIPASGPVILASNHLTVVDSFFLVLMVRRRITFVAKSEYFTEGGAKGRAKRWFFTAAGQVPIDRSGASAAESALNTAKKILDDGNSGESTPRAPGRPTVDSTRARPESPGSRSRRAPRSCPSPCTAHDRSTPSDRGCGGSAR
ncbi:hypothetical protein Pd630_LPD00582 [Rhodococcus opacus PD630]|nr:hypothetical protein Pd630_LPD00582 [Rhodococcus opacus PD630]